MALHSAPYTLIAAFIPHSANLNASQVTGIYLGDGTHTLEFGMGAGTSGLQAIYTEPSVANIQLVQYDPAVFWPVVWMKITDDGTHRTLYLSADGISWRQWLQEATVAHLTPTRAGFVARAGSWNAITLASWSIS